MKKVRLVLYFILFSVIFLGTSSYKMKDAFIASKSDSVAYVKLLAGIKFQHDSILNVYQHTDEIGKQRCLKKTEQYLINTYYKKIMQAWLGTKWEFYGEAQVPGIVPLPADTL